MRCLIRCVLLAGSIPGTSVLFDERNVPRMTVPSKAAARALRPSLLVAEALVDRQGPNQIVDRAHKLGYSPVLTDAVVGVCCGQQHCTSEPAHSPSASQVKSAQS